MSSRDPQKMQDFMKDHPNLDFNKVNEGFQNSKYGTYDLTGEDYTFKTVIK